MDRECASLVDKCKTEVACHNCVYVCSTILYVRALYTYLGQAAGGGDGHEKKGPLDTPFLHIILWSVCVCVFIVTLCTPHMITLGVGTTRGLWGEMG